jgi:hypothetical protein
MNPIFIPFFLFGDDDSGSVFQGRFAIFILSSLEEARKRIDEAYSQITEPPIHVIGFDEEEGYLQFKEADNAQDFSMGKKKKDKIETKDTIKADKFRKNVVLLVELFDCDGDPITENMLLTYYIQQQLNPDKSKSSI